MLLLKQFYAKRREFNIFIGRISSCLIENSAVWNRNKLTRHIDAEEIIQEFIKFEKVNDIEVTRQAEQFEQIDGKELKGSYGNQSRNLKRSRETRKQLELKERMGNN